MELEHQELLISNNMTTQAGSSNTQTTQTIYKRPSWKEYFNKIAELTSTRSVCPRLQVGCVLVSNNRLIAQGYNGYLSGCPHDPIIDNNHNIATIHAEQNAIIDCAKRGVSCDGCDAYVTHYPCFNCMKFMCAAGVKHIHYANDYNNDANVEIIATLNDVKLEKL